MTKITRFPPSAKLGEPMATYTKPPGFWRSLALDILGILALFGVIFAALVVCYVLSTRVPQVIDAVEAQQSRVPVRF